MYPRIGRQTTVTTQKERLPKPYLVIVDQFGSLEEKQLLSNIVKAIQWQDEAVEFIELNREPLPSSTLLKRSGLLIFGEVTFRKINDDLKNSSEEMRSKLAGYCLKTYHPAEILRDPSLKRKVWTDLQEFLKALSQH
jgi:hypothetical protein